MTTDSAHDMRIAVVGMSGRFPGAADVESFWQMICAGREGIRDLSDEELSSHGATKEELGHPRFVRRGAPLDGYDLFDARFFGVTPRDAELMDPQHRLMLEVSHSALEAAGYGNPAHRPLTGVFVGSSMSHYAFQIFSQGGARGPMASLPAQIGNGDSHLATRISYKLDLHGPSLFVQTACSTSLTAIHLACRSLLSFECDMALAGGSSLTMPYPAGYVHMEGGMLSADGHCRPFDAAATGTVIGNGAAAVILKRYADAVRDGDTIHALVLGSAINNDGADRAGYTAPSRNGQVSVIAEALGIADVPAQTIELVEAHGTGTIIGDPIELDSLSRAYRAPAGNSWIGSVKSNVGHMLAAAGVAAFIKAVFALKTRTIPPSANFSTPNPHIDFDATPFRVADTSRDWAARSGHPRRASVSSFGIGGSNAHIVLEEPPQEAVPSNAAPEPETWQLIPLSAATPTALIAASHGLASALPRQPAQIGDIAWTLQTGRRELAYRAAVVASTAQDAAAALEAIAEGDDHPVAASGLTGLLFPGQGMQRAGMFRGLFAREGAFRSAMLAAAAIYDDLACDDLIARIMGEGASDSDVMPTAFAQPALFAVGHALALQLMDWGLSPGILLGHSVGDFAAAAVAGVLSAEDAMRAVTRRGQLMQAQAPGAMYAVSLSAEEVSQFVAGPVVLAAINAPNRSVLAVPEQDAVALEGRLSTAKALFQRLQVSHAFHSPMMEPAAKELTEFMRGISLSPPRIPMVSSATGALLADTEATDPDFWGQQIVRPVRFLDGLRTLAQSPIAALIEAGPGDAMTRFARSVVPSGTAVFAIDPGRRKVEDQRGYLEVLGKAWCAGAVLDWDRLGKAAPGGRAPRRVPLPTYRFDHQRFWISAKGDTNEPASPAGTASDGLAKRAEDVADWFYIPSWRRTVAAPALRTDGGDWLLFVQDGDPLGSGLAERLEKRGRRVVCVRPGAEFSSQGEAFTVRPDAPEDYRQLLQNLGEQGFKPARIVHALGLGPMTGAAAEKQLSFVSPMLLAQAIGHVGINHALTLTILAEGAQRVGSADCVYPERALGIGPAKVIGQEFPGVESRHVDVVVAEWSGDQSLDRLLAELDSSHPVPFGRPRDQSRIVALRGADRWVQTFEKAALPDPAPINPGGVHVVTGGLGGVGSVIAEAIARAAPSTLVLTTRSADMATSDAALALRSRIEQSGSIARVVSLDPTDEAALTELFAGLSSEFGRIGSIVHAAGAPGAGMIQLKTVETANQVLAPKYEGTLAIERALENAQVNADLMLHCSSLTSVRGGFGQVDYCAANAFLDAFAQASRCERIGRTVSVNWGAWAEVGMAVASVQKFGLIPCPFWLRSAGEAGPPIAHPLLERVVTSPEGARAVRLRLDSEADWILSEHKLRGRPTMPGTGHLEILRAACGELGLAGPVELRDVEFRSPASVAEGERMELLVLAEQAGSDLLLRIVTRPGQDSGGVEVLIEHVRARAVPAGSETGSVVELSGIRGRLSPYEAPESPGESPVALGLHWQIPGRTLTGEGESMVELAVPDSFAGELDDYGLHPALLDVALGAARLAVGSASAMLPFGYGRIRISADRLPAQLLCLAQRRSPPGASMAVVDAKLLDANGKVLVEIEGYRLRQIDPGAAVQAAPDAGQASPQQVSDALAGAILSHEGAQAFLAACSAGERQLVISPLDLDAVVAKWQADERSMVERVAKADLSRGDGKPKAAADGAAPQGDVEARIAAIWQDLLGYTSVPRDADFFELGGDSLLGIQLHNRIQEAFSVTLTLASVFENPTVALLARLVSSQGDQEAGEPQPAAQPIRATEAVNAEALLAEFEK